MQNVQRQPQDEQERRARDPTALLQVLCLLPPDLRRPRAGAPAVRDQLPVGVHRLQGLLHLPRQRRRGQDALLRPLRQRVSVSSSCQTCIIYNIQCLI